MKWHPHNAQLLACACMHNGFAVLNISEQTQKFIEEDKILHSLPHESLAYGIDWCSQEGRNVLASASFYDKRLTIWRATE